MTDRTNIDETDAKILRTLLKEARTSFTEIAKDCKISVGAVRKRYSRLRRTGIISGKIMQVNPRSLGYKCIANVGIMTAKEDESKVIEFLERKPYSRMVFRNLFEKTNIAVIVSLQSFEELPETLREIEANPAVKHAGAFTWSKTSNLDYPENLVLEPSIGKTERESHIVANTVNLEKAKVDKTDRQIAKILSQDSRTPFTKIAEELNVSTKKVIERYSRLKGSVLTSSTITVDLRKLGYNAMALLLMKVAHKVRTPEILTEMLQISNLITVMELFGEEDVLQLIIVLRDYEELFRLKRQLNMIQGIERLELILSEPYQAWPLNLFASLL